MLKFIKLPDKLVFSLISDAVKTQIIDFFPKV